MATRATRLSPEHVTALNTIDIGFRHDKKVISAWRLYLDALDPTGPTTADRLVDLFCEMSEVLKFEFDKVMLKRVVYLPQAHVDAATIQNDITRNLKGMLAGQRGIQQGLLQYLSGEKALRICIDPDDGVGHRIAAAA